MSKPIDILKKYWGFDAFRPLQEDIIQSVLDGKDTLALLPTGGGKSICFQVPALCQEGICIVVSPLIALMKDQVENLRKRNIKALCVTSEYSRQEIDALFDRCIYEDIRFLYLSPERLLTEMARVRIAQMKVNLIAVDEAHCISEWGYDFRPPYLQIAEIRELHPKVPIIALTASATPTVIKDIQDKLEFKRENVFAKSFKRDNLAYFIDWDDNKFGKIERIARKVGGSGIIYLRSRRGTERIARELVKRGIRCNFYHAGLSADERQVRQEAWMQNKVQIIAATNAFGMGIDKPDVRFVVHLDLPDTLENYYQECGRGGRDGKRAFAVSVLSASDLEKLREKLATAFPSKAEIKQVYQAMCNVLQLAVGSGKDETFDIPLEKMEQNYNLDQRKVITCLKFLEKEGYISVEDRELRKSSLRIIVDNEQIYQLRVSNVKIAPLVEILLRSYSRLFDERVDISEGLLAKRLKWSYDHVDKGLKYLHEYEYIDYKPSNDAPRITFTNERIDGKNLRISEQHYQLRKKIVTEKVEYMLHYAESTHKCRSRIILEYFGETDARDCGICDYCVKKKHEA